MLYFFRKLFKPVIKFIAKICIPKTNLSYEDFEQFKANLKPSVAILSLTEMELSNLLVPEKWGHASVFSKRLSEQVTKGFVFDADLAEFFYKKNHLAIFEPLFHLNLEAGEKFLCGIQQNNPQYDWEANVQDKKEYNCIELVVDYFTACNPEAMKDFKRSNKISLIPADIEHNTKLFKKIYER